MNASDLKQAVERLGPLYIRGSESPTAALGRQLGVAADILRMWERRDAVPEHFASKISKMLEDSLAPLVRPSEPTHTTAASTKDLSMESGQISMRPEPTSIRALDGLVEDLPPLSPVDDAIRLWQVDQALMHLTRNAGALGLAGNAVQRLLHAERDHLIARLRQLAPTSL